MGEGVGCRWQGGCKERLAAWEKNGGWDGWNGLAVKGEQVGGESMQVGDGRGGWRKEKKEREWATDLCALVWAKGDELGLKEMGLGRKKWAWEVQWAE